MRACALMWGAWAAVCVSALPAGGHAQDAEELFALELVIDDYAPGRNFREPMALEVSPRDRAIYVGDTGNDSIGAFNSIGALRRTISGHPGARAPVGLAAWRDGRLLVTEHGSPVVKVLGPKGEVEDMLDVGALNMEGVPAPDPPSLGRLALGKDDMLYIVDRANSRIVVFDLAEGAPVQAFGGSGTAPGEFLRLEDIGVAPDGSIYAVDSMGTPLQRFDGKGRHVRSLGKRGNGPEEISLAVACHVDRFGQVWLVDNLKHQIVVFSPAGTELLRFGQRGARRGEFDGPIDVSVDRFGKVYVLEQTGRRVQVFQTPRPFRPFTSVARPISGLDN